MARPRFLTGFLNLGHALDHLLMLTFPTVVLTMAAAFGWGYDDMLELSLGGFIAFGAGSLPAGWLGDKWSRRGMMIVFFVGIGAAAILAGCARSPWQLAAALTLLGAFAAIYHPVGIAMLVKDEARVGRALGINGIAGNLGVALAAVSAGAIAELVGWRAAFIIPGIVAMLCGIAFALAVPTVAPGGPRRVAKRATLDNATIARVFIVLLIATSCGGVISNATTIAMPKVFDERLRALTNSTLGVGALAGMVYTIAAFAQYCVGRLIYRASLRAIFVPVALMQVPLLGLAASLSNGAMLAAAVAMMFFVFGQIPINDAMVARYTDERWRARIYAVRYVVSCGASSLAVPLIASLHGAEGGFASVFVLLSGLAGLIAVAALWVPRQRVGGASPAVAPAEAEAASYPSWSTPTMRWHSATSSRGTRSISGGLS